MQLQRVKLRVHHQSRGTQHLCCVSSLSGLRSWLSAKQHDADASNDEVTVVYEAVDGSFHALTTDDDFQALQDEYARGLEDKQDQAVRTYRVKVVVQGHPEIHQGDDQRIVSIRDTPSSKSIRCARSSYHELLNQKRAKPEVRTGTPPMRKRCSSNQLCYDGAAGQSCTPTTQALSWDEQVLDSIKRTVTKLHFGSRLSEMGATLTPPA